MQLKALAGAIGLAAASMTAGVASAQASDPWQFGAQIYLFIPSIDGESGFPPSESDPGVSVDVGQIIDTLQFVFMGSLEARKGRWGAMTDVIYLNVGGDASGTRDLTIGGTPVPVTASASVDYDLDGWLWMIAGEYMVISQSSHTMDIFSGARMFEVEQGVGWDLQGDIGGIPEAGRTGSAQAKRTNWDAIVGVKGRWRSRAESPWFVPYYLDVGTGESDYTWQTMAGVGYSWQWIETLAGWRYLDYELGEGRPLSSLSLNGPLVSVNFHW
jgi:hypothetical protein